MTTPVIPQQHGLRPPHRAAGAGARVGIIGPGDMARSVALRLMAQGVSVSVLDASRTPLGLSPPDNAAVLEHPAALAADSNLLLLFTDATGLRAALDGPNGLLQAIGPQHTVVQMGTITPDATLALASAVAERTAHVVEAVPFGAPAAGEKGNLTILTAGTTDELAPGQAVLQFLGRRIVHCGELGQAARANLVLRLLLGGMTALFGEAVILGRYLDVDLRLLLQAMEGGPLAAPVLLAQGAAIHGRDLGKDFPVDLMHQELGLVLQTAGVALVPLPLTALARELYSTTRALGFGEDDIAAVYRALQHMAGQ